VATAKGASTGDGAAALTVTDDGSVTVSWIIQRAQPDEWRWIVGQCAFAVAS